MSEREWAVTSVEVRYTPTAADFREAFAVLARHTAPGRRSRSARRTVSAGAAAGAGLLALVGGAALLPAALLLVCALWALFAPSRIQARRVVRKVADKGEFRVLLDECGVVVSHEASDTLLGWPEQRYFLETRELFLLLAGAEEPGVVTVLPKRGVEDVRGLGQLIGRHAEALVPD
ncbi:hypothetical protein ACGF13_36245 [Kitasatospora sp. NPDC048286]|uniref:hypothetical protein n=1 Tax=unclassified Kitasatospora TaxID=2633591 RepID=UPI003721B01B